MTQNSRKLLKPLLLVDHRNENTFKFISGIFYATNIKEGHFFGLNCEFSNFSQGSSIEAACSFSLSTIALTVALEYAYKTNTKKSANINRAVTCDLM